MREIRGYKTQASDSPEEAQAKREGLRGFGPMVRQLRKDAGLTRVSFAKKAKCDASTLASIEEGKVRPTIEWPRIASVVLGAPFSVLFDVWSAGAPDGEERMTVAEAKAMIERLLSVGVDCPCCGRPCKELKRSLSPPMVRFARWLCRNYRGAGLDAKSFVQDTQQHGGDYAKVIHWGLAVKSPETGLWSPTKLCKKWVRGEVKVQKQVVLWRNSVLRTAGDLVSVEDIDHDTPPARGEQRHLLPGMG